MPCYHPVPANREVYRETPVGDFTETVVRSRVTLFPDRSSQNLQIPCGRCLGCKQKRAQEWALRVVHETRYHDSSLFVTLTYDEQHLPHGGSLVPRDLQLFLKTLRKAAALGRTHIVGRRLRYIACGEYGETTFRPHYHAILFGLGFDDERQATAKLRESPTLSSLWGKGNVYYGEVSAASAAYVAAYTVKSVGQTFVDPDGVVLPPPFFRCSTRPGIGARYADSFADDFRSGTLVVDGQPRAVPRYYQKRIKLARPFLAEEAEQANLDRQQERVLRDPLGASPDRLVAGEIIAQRKRELSNKPTF